MGALSAHAKVRGGVWGLPWVAAWAFVLVALLSHTPALGQSGTAQNPALPYPTPVGAFDTDTALLASPVHYSLSVKRPAKTQVLFPDSLYPFTPFELRLRTWFPTRRTADSMLVDSAVYELMSFTGTPTLTLSLPIFYLNPQGDSVPVYAPDVSLHQRLLQGAEGGSDTLLPAIQTLAVPERFNYPYWIIGISLLVGLLAVANVFLGKPLQRYFRLWVERRRHKAFIRTYDRLVIQVRDRGAQGPLERALNLWKAYIERVEEIPYTTYTTKDFAEHLPDRDLTNGLQTLDRYIYGGFPPDEASVAYATLRRQAVRFYTRKAQNLRHG